MYTARVPSRSSPPAILLRESFRQDGKVKSRTLANLTSWPPERIQALDRALKTGALKVRPIFVQKAGRTRGNVFCCMPALKLVRTMEQRLRAAFATTAEDPHALTLPDALTALGHLCLLHYPTEKPGQVAT